MANGLTQQQRTFAEALLEPGTLAKDAALIAGYATAGAESYASQLLTNPKVAAYLTERRSQIAAAADISRERVLRELARIAFADPRSVMAWGPDGVRMRDSGELTDDQAAAVAEVSETLGRVTDVTEEEGGQTRVTKVGGTMKVKMHDKARALDTLAKYLRILPEAAAPTVNVDARTVVASESLLAAIIQARQQGSMLDAPPDEVAETPNR